MNSPDTTPPAAPPGRRTGWLALTASQRGAAHVATKLPNQDAVIAQEAGPGGVVAAVGDGHGHWRHSRSARGSQFAVSIGCQAGQELASQLKDEQAFPGGPDSAAPPVTDQIGDLVRDTLVPAIVRRWREAVLADVAADPFNAEEQEARQDGDDPTIAYGSTLLLAVAVRQWLVLAQIGDGDIVGVRADGAAVLPVPDDPQLDGRFTTSLCGPDARSDFRAAVVDTGQAPLAAVMLASDGYGNAQIADQWTDAFSKDLAEMIRERDDQWLAAQLPMWAARCASADGSADDTTVALLLGPPGLSRAGKHGAGTGGNTPEAGSEETTVPAMLHSPTIPNAPIPTGTIPTGTVPTDTVPATPIPTGTVPTGPGSTGTGGTRSASTGPVIYEVDTDEPDVTEPVAAEPVADGPAGIEPVTTELAATKLPPEPTPPEPTASQATASEAGPTPDSQETAPWPGDR